MEGFQSACYLNKTERQLIAVETQRSMTAIKGMADIE